MMPFPFLFNSRTQLDDPKLWWSSDFFLPSRNTFASTCAHEVPDGKWRRNLLTCDEVHVWWTLTHLSSFFYRLVVSGLSATTLYLVLYLVLSKSVSVNFVAHEVTPCFQMTVKKKNKKAKKVKKLFTGYLHNYSNNEIGFFWGFALLKLVAYPSKFTSCNFSACYR